jgi:hypothetical protein
MITSEAKNLASLITRLHDLAYNMLPSADEGCFEK